MIRVLIVDDHPIVRDGVAAVLEDQPDLFVVGSVGSAEEALALGPGLRPDIILLDLELPTMDGVAAMPQLIATVPRAQVLVFTAYDTDERLLGALESGAKGYLLKGMAAADLIQAIRSVYSGGSALAPQVAARVLAAVKTSGRSRSRLSPREREVLGLLAQGLATKQIARSLGITERTVKYHVRSIFAKLGAVNRAQAVALAAQQHLL
jgi:DNA-binding NarL/FixJ family response regulator